MEQGADDAGTQAVQLLHGLRAQAQGQVRVQAVVPAQPGMVSAPGHSQTGQGPPGADLCQGKTPHLTDHRTLVNPEGCKGVVLLTGHHMAASKA